MDDLDTRDEAPKAAESSLVAPPVECAMTRALELIANKWTVPVVHILHLAGGAIRFRAIQRRVGGIAQKELTKRLRELERAGLVGRKVHPEVPPRVEYELTPLGRTLVPPLSQLACWAELHGPALAENRRRYDAAHARRP